MVSLIDQGAAPYTIEYEDDGRSEPYQYLVPYDEISPEDFLEMVASGFFQVEISISGTIFVWPDYYRLESMPEEYQWFVQAIHEGGGMVMDFEDSEVVH